MLPNYYVRGWENDRDNDTHHHGNNHRLVVGNLHAAIGPAHLGGPEDSYLIVTEGPGDSGGYGWAFVFFQKDLWGFGKGNAK